MGNWTSISNSEYPWEQDALTFVRNHLPDSSPIQAWSNFEFMAEGGAIYEIDLLVVGPWGAFLIEIKSRPGVISSQGGTWTWRDGTKHVTHDNPLPLANRKAKALKSLLERTKCFVGKKVPFIEPLIFCSHESNRLDFKPPHQHSVCVRDKQASSLSGIVGAITRREPDWMKSFQTAPINKEQIRSFCLGIEAASLRPIQKTRKAGDYVLTELFHDSPLGTFQEWLGHHVQTKSGPRLVRVYLEGLQDARGRQILQRAAEREFQILERLEHENILRIDTLTETNSGPALVFRWQEGSQRLDHYLASRELPLPADISLSILEQITDAIAYAHRKNVVHRGLSPQSIIVLPHEEGATPKVQIFSWQLGIIDSGTAGGMTQLSRSLHAGQFVEDEATVFFAPEAVSGQNIEGEELDSFSIGALAYYLCSGKPPGDSLLDLDQKLREKGYLDICSVQNGVSSALAELIQFTARTDRTLRSDADHILKQINKIWEEITAPETAKVVDPRTAKPGELLEHGYKVLRHLGSGSSSRVLLVENADAERVVLKVASKQDYSERIESEFATIQKIRHPNVIRAFHLHHFQGLAGFTMEPAFSMRKRSDTEERTNGTDKETSLARRLREDGQIHELSLLHRFGEQLLQAIDELERLGIGHRDIKPDNLGIRSVKKSALQLVLFDFSLANSPAENTRLGTPPYLDPFIKLPGRQRWDHHAERFGAAMTLHQMVSGVLPTWGADGNSPELIEDEADIRSELFPGPVRDRLTTFFEKALARELKDRFDNTEQMLTAWRKIFESLDEPAVAQLTDHDDPQPSRAEILESATPETQLVLLGLSVRLTTILERFDLITINDILRYPIGRFRRLRGVGYKTNQEVLALHRQLHERFPNFKDEELVSEAAKDASKEPEHASVDLIARQLILTTAVRKESAERDIHERFLGWKTADEDPAASHWMSQTELASLVEVTRARIGQVLTKARLNWQKNAALTRLRSSMYEMLLSQGGVVTHTELIRLVLLQRGSTLNETESLRMASIATRAAVESESVLQKPRFLEYRRQGVLFIAADPAYVRFAQQLGETGKELACRDPLPTASRVIETLGAILFPQTKLEDVRPPDQARRAHLAASISEDICVNSRLELYPRGLDAERALMLSRSALFGARELTLDAIRNRVASRYPEAEPLPGRPQLDALLTQSGLPLKWDASAADGAGAYCLKHPDHPTGSSFTIGSRSATIDQRKPQHKLSEEAAEAERIEEKLRWAKDHGSYLVLAANPRHLEDAAQELLRFGVERISASALFIHAMKEQAALKRIQWPVVLNADRAPLNSNEWKKLQTLVQLSLPGVRTQLRDPNRNILLTDIGLFARYDRMNELDALRNDAGTQTGAKTLWILVPDSASTIPTICRHPVPITNDGQFEVLTPDWIKNRHRGSAPL